MARRRRKKSDITLWDYARLRMDLMSRPAYVLRHFQRCQVGCLEELAVYREIRKSDPDAARRIDAEARKARIPIHHDDLVGDDVLCDRPGEV